MGHARRERIVSTTATSLARAAVMAGRSRSLSSSRWTCWRVRDARDGCSASRSSRRARRFVRCCGRWDYRLRPLRSRRRATSGARWISPTAREACARRACSTRVCRQRDRKWSRRSCNGPHMLHEGLVDGFGAARGSWRRLFYSAATTNLRFETTNRLLSSAGDRLLVGENTPRPWNGCANLRRRRVARRCARARRRHPLDHAAGGGVRGESSSISRTTC